VVSGFVRGVNSVNEGLVGVEGRCPSIAGGRDSGSGLGLGSGESGHGGIAEGLGGVVGSDSLSVVGTGRGG